MSTAWGGADPTQFNDPGNSYELGTKYTANATITLTQVRLWHGANDTAITNRRAHIWSAAGALLATAVLPDTLPSGWSTYNLDASVPISAGQQFWVTYQVRDWYAAILNAYGSGVPSADGQVTAVSGGFNTIFGQAPATTTTTFYGADAVYTGNQAPVVGIAVAVSGYLTASATLTIQDETPASVGYKIEWGDGQVTSVTGNLGPHTHVYATAGTYAVMVTATDSAGLMDSAAAPVTVYAAPGALTPNDELVAARWLATIPGITPAMVATTLPRDNATWAASGFVQVAMTVGGGPDLDVPMRDPVVQVELWAVNPASQRPPWWKAANLGELIIAACQTPALHHQLLTIGGNYRNARVTGVYVRSGPRRLPRDAGSYAHFVMDLALDWAAV